LGRGAHIALCDLRASRCTGERVLPSPPRACAIDADGTRLIVLDATGKLHPLAASMADWIAPAALPDHAEPARGKPVPVEPTTAALRGGILSGGDPLPRAGDAAPSPGETCDDLTAASEIRDTSRPHHAPPRVCGAASRAGEVDRPARSDKAHGIGRDPPERDPLAAVQGLRLRALGPPIRRALAPEKLEAYLADARAWVVSLCRTALATGYDTGRLGGAEPMGLDAVLGDQHGRATDALGRAQKLEESATERFSRWNRRGAPHIELARELRLSPLAISLLLLSAAPQIWGELARAYSLCTADRARPLVDELLLAHLLKADIQARAAIGRELDPDAPLVDSGAVALARGLRPYAGLSVHPAIARRLIGAPPTGDRDEAILPATRDLTKVIGPRAQIAEVARQLVRRPVTPVRVVLRGRTNSGRRTTAAALAGCAGRRIGLVAIDAASKELEILLAQRLHDVSLRGGLPCVILDDLASDPALHVRIRPVLDRHPGPLFIRAPHGGDLPLSPGYLTIEFAALPETERRAAWETTLAEHGLDLAPAATLAARFHVGPGAMARACAAARAVASSAPTTDSAPNAALEARLAATLRQHRSARIEAIARRVERLASWDDLIVPDDISDALRELCARVRHRRTVLEDWSMRDVAATAQGTVALFQGAPGTGKTMAAEVIANALGYELWRVDLSKVVSKWIGETEKNLAAVFDAAEDGEIVLLFDEADSLFGKRTEVKSSHDRNANLETSYLLQRLDSFTGIAILTTNFGTAIDPAFLRRISVQAQFPLPDELERERLWRALLPRTLPIAGEPDLAELARRYSLTGGYIRNAVLRAAYVAAGRGTPLSSADLERAVRAEYLARGKVSTTGALT
ncbi:MAG TPA: ATP-binding protein, partial [Kofleriaceae bacterium]